ncbi:hypothetical protein FF100_26365 [Methylobacterium terricola]|uniref:Uncharacterized protein n=1 Tax=Methylobacterium terricola TaxID=2583531 RepID=A0A5C4LA09_9HYPH|nr:hypothetical protein [Methylobacterium terricola]TNC09365.1 hypothetical protein FF100_26365 [Methylobacterium terricola]
MRLERAVLANGARTEQLLAEGAGSDMLGDIHAMQAAFVRQIGTIEPEWRAGCLQISPGSASLRKANALSRIVEQRFDFVGQVGDLMVDTMTRTAGLIETATVGDAYRLSGKISERRAQARRAGSKRDRDRDRPATLRVILGPRSGPG